MEPSSKSKELTVITGLSIVICGFILWLVYYAPKTETDNPLVVYLPALFTLCNALCASFLIRGYLQVRQKNISAHKKSMLIATGFSAGFLVFYIAHYIFHVMS